MAELDYIKETGTLLKIAAPGGLPFYSAKGLTQTLEPIEQASQLARTVNGKLVDLGLAQFRKYKSTIAAADIRCPSVVWPGMQIVVDCVAELNYKTATGSPERTVVTGTSRVEGDFTFYKPRLAMRVIKVTTQFDEWPHSTSWSMDLEEV